MSEKDKLFHILQYDNRRQLVTCNAALVAMQISNQINKDLKEAKLVVPQGVHIRDYQLTAYENWSLNNYTGIFAMATGTGKTITSIHCVYKEHIRNLSDNNESSYHLVILVPTQPLLEQWSKEIQLWGLNSKFLISGQYNWKFGIQELLNDYTFGIPSDFAIIATYRSLTKSSFIQVLNKLPEDTILIADEAHSLGQNQIKSVLSKIQGLKKRIGLSATPKRQYDEEGTAEMETFFSDSAPYVYSLFMEKAIDLGFLCRYDYYPILVELTPKELEEYVQISKRIAILMSKSSEDGAKKQQIEYLVLKRKKIINNASNKLQSLSKIIKMIKENEELTFCFTYAPAGELKNETDSLEGDNIRMIREMQKIFDQESPGTRTHAYLGETENRQEVLKSFEKGEIDVLLAINCLDEGIDVPRTGIGIFTSSTGNPRQYIQRRGRLLRKHKDKTRATIYDMVVIPKIFGEIGDNPSFRIQKGQVRAELMRVGYFAKLSENFYDTTDALNDVCDYYKLNLNTIVRELEE